MLGNAVEKARKLIRESGIGGLSCDDGWYFYDVENSQSSTLDTLDAGALARCFSYVINIVGTRAGRIGASKQYGQPHLPASWRLPAECRPLQFHMQLNLSDLKQHDLENRFPSSGMLYFFVHEETTACRVVHVDVTDELVARDDIPVTEDKKERYLAFQPTFLFYANDGDAYDYSPLQSMLPKDLVSRLCTLLGCSSSNRNRSFRLFGRPITWQGEDEMDSDELDEEPTAEELAEMLEEMDSEEREAYEKMSRLMEARDSGAIPFLHDAIDDANVCFWANPAKLRAGDLGGVYMTASTT